MKDKKETNWADEIQALMALLRDPEKGCDWDRAQTLSSLVPYTIEEVYELADAIENGDEIHVKEELGDLLFHLFFYCQIAEETQRFTMAQVAKDLAHKIKNRHADLFQKSKITEVPHTQNWEAEKHANSDHESRMDNLPKNLPSLIRAHKMQQRAAGVGFDWPCAEGAWEKCQEELQEINSARESKNKEELEEELGDLFFSLVNVCRHHGFNADTVMRKASDKFEKRFRIVERLATEKNVELQSCDLAGLERLWQRAKRES